MTGNLCPKKSGGKLSLKKKKKKKKKLEGFILLCIMFVDLKGVRGACTDHFKSKYWYFFISCDGKLALRIFSSAYILFATSPEIGDSKFDSVFWVSAKCISFTECTGERRCLKTVFELACSCHLVAKIKLVIRLKIGLQYRELIRKHCFKLAIDFALFLTLSFLLFGQKKLSRTQFFAKNGDFCGKIVLKNIIF